ncbi:MAG: DUF4249 family protein [Gemmatimonadaceae bacterium]|nr:DUF4249 family protein [Gemmatimonadaceae bacterium]
MVTRRVWHRVLATTAGACILVAGLGACEIAAVQVSSPKALVIVHAVLNPDAGEQVILVESSLTGRVSIDDSVQFDPLDPIRTAGGEPIEGADVRLLAGSDTVGVRAVEGVVDGRRTGRYVVPNTNLSIQPGQLYRLRIRTAGGDVVTGETRVPSAPAGWSTGVGSSPTPAALFRATDTLRVQWTAVGNARTYAIRVETPDGPWFLWSDSTQFSLPGGLRNFFAAGLPSVWYPGFLQSLSVVAVDAQFYDYNRSGNDPFGGSGLISSVRGGLGLFGSVLPLLRRDIAVTDRLAAPLDGRWEGTPPRGTAVALDLWVETAGPSISSVSGRVLTSANRYVVGTLQGETVRLITLNGISKRDTLAAFTGRFVGDSLVGSYNPRFDVEGPTRFRRISP